MDNNETQETTLQVDKAQPKELCRITVVFPLRDDTSAMNLRREIAKWLANDPQAQITFTIASLPGQFIPPSGPEKA